MRLTVKERKREREKRLKKKEYKQLRRSYKETVTIVVESMLQMISHGRWVLPYGQTKEEDDQTPMHIPWIDADFICRVVIHQECFESFTKIQEFAHADYYGE